MSKIGHHFSNEKNQEFILSKNVNNKKYAVKLVFFNEKKMRKIQMIFDIGFESQILALFDSSPLIQNSKFNNFVWGMLILRQKIFLILYPPIENFTARIAITPTI